MAAKGKESGGGKEGGRRKQMTKMSVSDVTRMAEMKVSTDELGRLLGETLNSRAIDPRELVRKWDRNRDVGMLGLEPWAAA